MLVFIMVSQKLVQAMLSKSNWVTYTYNETTSSSLTKTVACYGWSISLYVKQTSNSYTSDGTINVYNNSTNIYSDTETFKYWNATINKKFDLTDAWTFRVLLTKGSSSRTYNIIISQNKTKNSIKNGAARELKEIWEKATITTIGNHIDNTFIHDYPDTSDFLQFTDDEYKTSTFDITAYRGYIYITFWGHKYKVPYTDRTDIE